MKQVSVEIIHKCPNRCLHCSSYSDSSRTLKIDTEKVYEIIDSAVLLDTEILSISGGEPFLHEGLVDITRYAKNKGIKVYIYTSGIVLDDKFEASHIDLAILKELKEAGADKIIFDFPAIDESVYDKFMGTQGYQKFVLESINYTKKTNIYTELHFVPTKINVGQIDHVIEYAEKNDIDKVSFLGLIPHGRAKENIEKLYLSKEDTEQLKRKLDRYKGANIRIGIPLQSIKSEYRCYAGISKLCVRYDGKVFGCEAFKYMQLKDELGNVLCPDSIYEKTLADIYFNSEYLKSERKFIEAEMKRCECNEKCPVQRMIRRVTQI